jgi:hypothetical protein
MHRFLPLALLIAVGWMPESCNSSGGGRFEGELKFHWVTEGTMELLAPYAYIDADGKRWDARLPLQTDGASIPSVFWSVVGSPFTGDYLPAAVVHDWYCVHRTESWEDVHRMFYQASLTAGVGEVKAKILYAAVYHFGPRWEEEGIGAGREVTFSPQLLRALERTAPIEGAAVYSPEERRLVFPVLERTVRAREMEATVKQREFFARAATLRRARDEPEIVHRVEPLARAERPPRDRRRVLEAAEEEAAALDDPQLREALPELVRAVDELELVRAQEARLEEAQVLLFHDVKRFIERGSPDLAAIERYRFE